MRTSFISFAAAPMLMASASPGVFPDIEDGWRESPETISTETVKGILPGMTRLQVYHLLGSPHFNEGIRARTWNYAFNLRQPGRADGVKCDVQLQFEKRRLARIQWKTESCANAVK